LIPAAGIKLYLTTPSYKKSHRSCSILAMTIKLQTTMNFVAIAIVISLFHILCVSKLSVTTQDWPYPEHPPHNMTKKINPDPLRSCLNGHSAQTPYAIVSMISKKNKLQRIYSASAVKLAKTIRKFTNVDLVMLAIEPLHPDDSSALEKAEWKICAMQGIQGPPNPKRSNRFLEANLYSKFNAWRLTEYEAILLLDSDTLAVGDLSTAFTHTLPAMLAQNKSFAAARDRPVNITCRFGTAWNVFNAGVILLLPSLDDFDILNKSIAEVPHDTDMAEQDLLNKMYASSFFELPFHYNAIVTSKVCEPDTWHRERENIKIVHFTTAKGWMYSYHWQSIEDPFQCWWWDVQDLCLLWESIPDS